MSLSGLSGAPDLGGKTRARASAPRDVGAGLDALLGDDAPGDGGGQRSGARSSGKSKRRSHMQSGKASSKAPSKKSVTFSTGGAADWDDEDDAPAITHKYSEDMSSMPPSRGGGEPARSAPPGMHSSIPRGNARARTFAAPDISSADAELAALLSDAGTAALTVPASSAAPRSASAEADRPARRSGTSTHTPAYTQRERDGPSELDEMLGLANEALGYGAPKPAPRTYDSEEDAVDVRRRTRTSAVTDAATDAATDEAGHGYDEHAYEAPQRTVSAAPEHVTGMGAYLAAASAALAGTTDMTAISDASVDASGSGGFAVSGVSGDDFGSDLPLYGVDSPPVKQPPRSGTQAPGIHGRDRGGVIADAKPASSPLASPITQGSIADTSADASGEGDMLTDSMIEAALSKAMQDGGKKPGSSASTGYVPSGVSTSTAAPKRDSLSSLSMLTGGGGAAPSLSLLSGAAAVPVPSELEEDALSRALGTTVGRRKALGAGSVAASKPITTSAPAASSAHGDESLESSAASPPLASAASRRRRPGSASAPIALPAETVTEAAPLDVEAASAMETPAGPTPSPLRRQGSARRRDLEAMALRTAGGTETPAGDAAGRSPSMSTSEAASASAGTPRDGPRASFPSAASQPGSSAADAGFIVAAPSGSGHAAVLAVQPLSPTGSTAVSRRVAVLEADIAALSAQLEKTRREGQAELEASHKRWAAKMDAATQAADMEMEALRLRLDARSKEAVTAAQEDARSASRIAAARIAALETELSELRITSAKKIEDADARIRAEEAAAADSRVAAAVAAARASWEREKASLEALHQQEVAALKRLHAQEASGWKHHTEQHHSLGALAAQVRSATSALEELQSKAAVETAAAAASRSTQLDARERIVSEVEASARAAAQRAADEVTRLQALLAAMESSMASSRRELEEDRQRLAAEHTRLATLQRLLTAEAEGARSAAAKERAELSELRSATEAERRALMSDAVRIAQEATIARTEADRTRAEAKKQAEDTLREARAESARILASVENVRVEVEALTSQRDALAASVAALRKDYDTLVAMRLAAEADRAAASAAASRAAESEAAAKAALAEVSAVRDRASADRAASERALAEAAAARDEAMRERQKLDATGAMLNEERRRLVEDRTVASRDRAALLQLGADVRRQLQLAADAGISVQSAIAAVGDAVPGWVLPRSVTHTPGRAASPILTAATSAAVSVVASPGRADASHDDDVAVPRILRLPTDARRADALAVNANAANMSALPPRPPRPAAVEPADAVGAPKGTTGSVTPRAGAVGVSDREALRQTLTMWQQQSSEATQALLAEHARLMADLHRGKGTPSRGAAVIAELDARAPAMPVAHTHVTTSPSPRALSLTSTVGATPLPAGDATFVSLAAFSEAHGLTTPAARPAVAT